MTSPTMSFLASYIPARVLATAKHLRASFLTRTDLQAACRDGDTERVRVLLNSGGQSVNSQTEGGATPLILAARFGHVATMEVLLKTRGIAVDAVDQQDCSALIFAISNGHAAAVDLLIKYDANVEELRAGLTPLMHCSVAGHAELLDVLLRAGAAVNATNTDGLTAVDLAHQYQQVHVERALRERGGESASQTKAAPPSALAQALVQIEALNVQIGLVRAEVRASHAHSEAIELELRAERDAEVVRAGERARQVHTHQQSQLLWSVERDTMQARIAELQHGVARAESAALASRAEWSHERDELCARVAALQAELVTRDQRISELQVASRRDDGGSSSSGNGGSSGGGSDKLCVFCEDGARTHAFLPCGHLAYCAACATSQKVAQCPICAMPSKRMVRIFHV